MKKFIAQTDMSCERCEAELPRGSHISIGNGDEVLCEDCAEELSSDLFAETYS
jgi:predicted amidophosphoribosyltransferase